MIIEETTTYAYKLKYIDNVSFNRIRAFAQSFVNELPQELVDDIFFQLNHGLDLLQNEPQMLVYLHSYGKMHEAKLRYAFDQLPDDFREQTKVNIIDYGCGQAIGTMCYADFLRENDIEQNIGTITLIEPSEICLKRAALHAKAFFPDAEIRTNCKGFDDLSADNILCDESTPTLHILSNVLDILDFDLERFAKLIDGQLCGYNQFVCVGPYFNYSDKDERMSRFAELLNGNVSYSKFFERRQLNPEKDWTAQIVCFSIGELEEELSTKVTEEEIRNGVKDKYGVIYSKDGKRLLKCYNFNLKSYNIKDGTKVICNDAFLGPFVDSGGPLDYDLIQINIPDSVIIIGKDAFDSCFNLKQLTLPKFLQKIEGSFIIGGLSFNLNIESRSNRFVVYNKMIIDTAKQQLIQYFGKEKIVEIPNTVTCIGNSAFNNCSMQQVVIPDSVTDIENSAFYFCTSLQQLTIPKLVSKIGRNPFWGCKNLVLKSNSSRFIVKNGLLIDNQNYSVISYIGNDESIIIPNSIVEISDSAFERCESLQQITIPDSVTSIGEKSFKGCKSLRQITIPNSVLSIGNETFSDCESLQEVNVADSVTSIGSLAFANCKSLQQITISESVTNIGYNPFTLCEKLALKSNSNRFIIQNGLLIDTQNNNIISYVGKDDSVIIPDSITVIGEGAFAFCQSLRQITIPDSVTSIEVGAFIGCQYLYQIILPNSITETDASIFDYCKSLKQIVISEGTTEKFKKLLPKELWDKLYYLKKAE